MLKGLDATTKSRFGLDNAERYFYLNQVGNTNIYIYILGKSYMVCICDVANRWVQCISIRPARRKMKVPRTQSQMLCLYELLVLSVDQQVQMLHFHVLRAITWWLTQHHQWDWIFVWFRKGFNFLLCLLISIKTNYHIWYFDHGMALHVLSLPPTFNSLLTLWASPKYNRLYRNRKTNTTGTNTNTMWTLRCNFLVPSKFSWGAWKL